MATRTRKTKATANTTPAATAAEPKVAKKLLPERWMTAQVVDAEQKYLEGGVPCVSIELTVTAPRLFAGTTLYHRVSSYLQKTLEAYEKRFPGVQFTNADSVWNAIGGSEVRVNVGIDPEHVDETTGEVFPSSNRVKSIYPQNTNAAADEAAA